jgi:hypothetical protein
MSYKSYFKHRDGGTARHLAFKQAEIDMHSKGDVDAAIEAFLIRKPGWTIPEFVLVGNILMSPDDPKAKKVVESDTEADS